MVLYKSKKSLKLDRISKNISLALSDREIEWNAVQKEKHNEREGEASESRKGERLCKETSSRLQILGWSSNICRRIASHSFWKGQSASSTY